MLLFIINLIHISLLQVGNALTDDFHDQLGMFEFMWSSGLISDQTYKLLNLLCDFQSVEHPSHSCEKIWEIANEELGNIDPYSLFTPPCQHANVSQLSRLVRRKHVSVNILNFLVYYTVPVTGLWCRSLLMMCYAYVMLQRIGRLSAEYDPCTEKHSIVY